VRCARAQVAKGEQSQTPTCVLDVQLPDRVAPRAGKSQVDCLNLDQSGNLALYSGHIPIKKSLFNILCKFDITTADLA
jgi:hypothetical protein